MRYITKRGSPQQFEDWKIQMGRRVTYKDLSHKGSMHIKNVVKESLIEEQLGLCCYCGISVDAENVHIEHFMPQTDYPARQLDYHNLHASCQGKEIHISQFEDELNFCGHSKGRWYDPQLTVSPLDPECEKYFLYGYDGTMEAQPGNVAAVETIRRLGLDTYLPTILRKAAIDAVLNSIDLSDPDTSEIDSWISFFQTPQSNNLPSFSYIIIHVLQTLK